MEHARYIANNIPPQVVTTPPEDYLQVSLEQLLRNTPPLQKYSKEHLGGLFSGYTGIAYLFLQLSATNPDLRVLGHPCIWWARQYLQGDRGRLSIEKGNCGLACEKLSYQAVVACVTGDNDHLVDFLANIPLLLGPYASSQGDPFPSELIYGRAGVLYMLRMLQRWLPNIEAFVDSPIRRISQHILATDDDGRGNWEWHGKRYFGAGHGDIGIITQLVLSDPTLAPQLADRFEEVLELQNHDGNWPSSERKLREGKKAPLVQWCHGAPGFIYSLSALKPFYPEMNDEIEDAIRLAQELVWTHGLLTKEPNLCHGIFGNAL